MDLDNYQLIGRGNTAEIYRIEDKKVLKLFHKGFSNWDIEREYQNSVLAQEALDTVPRVYEKVEVDGREGIIYEEVSGMDMLQMVLQKPMEFSKQSKQFARYHYSIHKPVKEDLIAVKDKLNFDIDAGNLLSEEAKVVLKEYLTTLPDGEFLCHFDFHPGNVMIVDEKVYFLDWMTACKGDICADAARTGILLKYGQIDHAPILVQKLLALGKYCMWKNYHKEYMKIAGISAKDIRKWEVPIAAARLRESISDKEKKKLLNFVNKQLHQLK